MSKPKRQEAAEDIAQVIATESSGEAPIEELIDGPIDESKAFIFIEKMIQSIEDSVDERGKVDGYILEALQLEGQKLLDEKEIIEDYCSRISEAINENKLDVARSLVNRLEKECGAGPDSRHWRSTLAWHATNW